MTKEGKLKSRKRMNTGVKVGLIAIGINLITVAVYMFQTNLMQKQQHASVWPYLEWRSIINESEGFSLIVSNNGIGPALVKSVNMKLNGKFVPTIDSLCTRLLGTLQFPHVTSVIENRVVPAGKSIVLLKSSEIEWAWQIYQKLEEGQFEMEICYESIYEDRWLSTGLTAVESRCN